MPDALVITTNPELSSKISELCKNYSFRVKSTSTVTRGLQWLSAKEFDLVVAGAELAEKDMNTLADGIWSASHDSLFVVVGDIASMKNQWQFYLLGAEVVDIQQIANELGIRLKRLQQRKKTDNVDRFNILVVEDLDSPRDVICSYIEGLGYPDVKGVSSAREALAELESGGQKYSCIVTDINMPQVNGRELIELVRKNPKLSNIPMIVLTAYGTVDCLIGCLKAGASGFLVKPPLRADFQKELKRAKKISSGKASPRLADEAQIDKIREALIDKGWQ